jgi:hypothetical protein
MVAASAYGQTGAGTQDTSCVAPLRPRWGSYLIQPFPSPAKVGEIITIQFYNHTEEILSCKIYDEIHREMIELQPKGTTPAGLHTFEVSANRLATGSYFVRLTTYTASGSETLVDNLRFVIVH